MLTELNAYFLPELVEPTELAGGLAVVIDLLRASSTICVALANGAKQVIPCLEVDEARQIAERLRQTGDTPLLGGERNAVRIEGFDLGNSPSEYMTNVAGRTVVFTTTNGTKAMNRCHQAERVLIGCFLNVAELAEEIENFSGPCHLICAGTKGKITREDVLAAGAIAERLFEEETVDEARQNDQARIAVAAWRDAMRRAFGDVDRERQVLAETLRDTQGGRNLIAAKLEQDIVDCAQLDSLSVVPELRVAEWRIVAAGAKRAG